MNTEQAYIKFQLKVNQNFENSKIAVDRGRFVLFYNEAQNKMVEAILDKKSNDEIRYIQKLLVPNYSISDSKNTELATLFSLPKNYFDFSSAYAKASTEKCKEQVIYLFEIKDDNKFEILQDEFNGPSFLAREAPMIISSDSLHAFKKDFVYDSLYLSYYRYPLQIKLLTEEDPESQFDPSVNPEFDDKFTDRIITMASSLFEQNNSNPKYQIDMQRAIQKM
jgi:hypothetical protein